MSESFEALLQQADELIKKAHEIRAKEKPAAIERIKVEIAKYELTFEDLGLVAPASGKRGRAETAAVKGTTSAAGKPKYRNPETGLTWTGRGQPPSWIKSAEDRDIYLIKN